MLSFRSEPCVIHGLNGLDGRCKLLQPQQCKHRLVLDQDDVRVVLHQGHSYQEILDFLHGISPKIAEDDLSYEMESGCGLIIREAMDKIETMIQAR